MLPLILSLRLLLLLFSQYYCCISSLISESESFESVFNCYYFYDYNIGGGKSTVIDVNGELG